MKLLKREPEFKPMTSDLGAGGRCSCCRIRFSRFGNYRVKAEDGRGYVAYLCIGCADTLRSIGLAR